MHYKLFFFVSESLEVLISVKFQVQIQDHRLVGIVVKASVSRAEDPGFDSRLRCWIFSGSGHLILSIP